MVEGEEIFAIIVVGFVILAMVLLFLVLGRYVYKSCKADTQPLTDDMTEGGEQPLPQAHMSAPNNFRERTAEGEIVSPFESVEIQREAPTTNEELLQSEVGTYVTQDIFGAAAKTQPSGPTDNADILDLESNL